MRNIIYSHIVRDDIGHLTVVTGTNGVLCVGFSRPNDMGYGYGEGEMIPSSEHDAARQIIEYLDGDRQKFELKLDIQGTAFREKVWRSLIEIPYGEVASYGEVAMMAGSPGGGRAVGQAVGRNNIGIIIPCHRVIASSGHLGGFGRGKLGLDLKKTLLGIEGVEFTPENILRVQG